MDRDLESAHEDVPRRGTGERSRLLLELLGLAAFQGLLLWNFRDHVDLNVADEAYHVRQGSHLAAGRFSELNYAWSLPLAGIYALLELTGPAFPLRTDLVAIGCLVGSTLALAWALRAFLGPTTALLAAAWWASASQSLALHGNETTTYALGLLLLSLALGLVARGRPGVALPVLVLAVLNRGESVLWLLAAGLGRLVPIRDGRPRSARVHGWLQAGAGLALLAALGSGWKARARAWLAFQQHYAAVHRGSTPEEVFPGATSVGEALFGAPGAFLEHGLGNAGRLPAALSQLVLDVWSWAPGARAVLVAVVGLLAALGLAIELRRGEPLLAGATREARRHLGASAVLLLPSLVLAPRPALLLPLVPLALVLLFAPARTGWKFLTRSRPWARPLSSIPDARVPWPRLLPALLVLLALPRALSRERSAAPGGTPNRDGVDLLRAHARAGATLLAAQADALLIYANLEGIRAVNPTGLKFRLEHGTPALEEVVEEEGPDLLLDTRRLRRRAGPAGLRPLLEEGGWEPLEERGAATLYARTSTR